MSITTYDGLVAGFASGQSFLFSKASLANTVAAQLFSLFRATGIPTQPAAPTATVTTCVTAVADTTGAFNWGMTVATGQTAYIAQLQLADSVVNTVFIADRLLHSGGYTSNATTLTSITAADLPADRGLDLTNYSDIHWFTEVYTDCGASGGNLTFTYDSPTSSVQTSVVVWPATARAGRLQEIIPNQGHPIVRLKSFRFTTATGTAGSWGITACKEHGMYPTNTANLGALYDFAQCGLHDIPSTARVFMYVLCSTTSTGIVTGMLRVVKG
jgi:hypothetical protein